MTSYVRPRDVHSIWLLLQALASETRRDVYGRAKDVLALEDEEEVNRLLALASSMCLVDSATPSASLTQYGESFASASHWRLWTVPDTLIIRFRRLGIDSLFLGSGSWEKRKGVVDLFGGAGGLSLAFESAGFSVRVAVDNDPRACEAFGENFPDCNVICGDVGKIASKSRSALQHEFGIELNDVFGVIGSPPCQGFSNIGERMDNDPRNKLAERFLDVVLNVEPIFFVFENVPALRTFGSRQTFHSFLMRLNRVAGSRGATCDSCASSPR